MNLLNFEEQFENLEDDDSSDSSSLDSEIDEKDLKLNNFDDTEYKINIRIEKRNGRKSIIRIENLPKFFLNNEKLVASVLNNLKIDLATRATLQTSKENYKFIELSGSRVDLVVKRLKLDLKCKNHNLILHNNI